MVSLTASNIPCQYALLFAKGSVNHSRRTLYLELGQNAAGKALRVYSLKRRRRAKCHMAKELAGNNTPVIELTHNAAILKLKKTGVDIA